MLDLLNLGIQCNGCSAQRMVEIETRGMLADEECDCGVVGQWTVRTDEDAREDED